MRRRFLFLLVVMLALAFGQTNKVDVVTTVGAIDSGQAQVEVTLNNGTAHSVTAWVWQVKGTYPDGSTQAHGGTIDLLGATDNQGPIDFRPGSNYQFPSFLPVVNGSAPTKVTATLPLVVFDDDTATGDPQMIRRFGAARKAMADMEAEEFAEIEAALKAPSPKDALVAAIGTRKANHKSDGNMQQILVLLKHNVARENIDYAISVLRQHQILKAAHTNLRSEVN